MSRRTHAFANKSIRSFAVVLTGNYIGKILFAFAFANKKRLTFAFSNLNATFTQQTATQRF